MNPFERTVLAMRKAQKNFETIAIVEVDNVFPDDLQLKVEIETQVDSYLEMIQANPLDMNPNQLRIDEV